MNSNEIKIIKYKIINNNKSKTNKYNIINNINKTFYQFTEAIIKRINKTRKKIK